MANKINYHVTLDELLSPLRKAKSGIHIKPENKGKFTAYKKRTGETTEQALHSKSPHVRKMANFARNASKWHHADEGIGITPIEREHPNADTIHPGGIDPTLLPQGALSPLTESDQTSSSGKPLYGGIGGYAVGALTALDALTPNRKIKRQQVVAPPRAYNPNPYGTSSQALMPDGGTIDPGKGLWASGNKRGYVDSTLNANKGLDWVKRLREKNAPSIQIPGQPGRSSHFMGDDEKGYVFPTVVRGKDGKLQYLGDKAEDYARDTKTGIQFPKEQGTWFANNGYKMGTDVNNNIDPITGTPFHDPNYQQYDYGGYVEAPKRFGYFKDEATNKMVFKKGGFIERPSQFPTANGIDAYNLQVLGDGGQVDDRVVFDEGGGIEGVINAVGRRNKFKGNTFNINQAPAAYSPISGDPNDLAGFGSQSVYADNSGFIHNMRDGGEMDNRIVWKDGGNIQPAAFPGNPSPMASRSSYPKGQGYKSKWIAPDGTTVPGIPGAARSNQAGAQQVDLNHQINTYDLLQRVIGQGGNPLNTDYGKTLRKQQDGISGKLVQAATIFNSRSDMLQKSPQERMEAFTSLQGHDPDVAAYIGRMKNAVGSNLESPDPSVTMQRTNGQNMTMASKAIASFDDGGMVQAGQQGVDFHYGGGAKTISYNPYSGPTMQFQGPSHEDGGIGMSYGGKKVEVEGNETGFVNQEGDFNVMGNMRVPGTNKKFKQVSKEIAKRENSAMNKADKGAQLMQEGDPNDAFDYLKFNSGRATTIGSDMKLKSLATAKEKLADVQRTILDTADRLGVEPNDLAAGKYTKAKYGKYMRKAEDGGSLDQSVEDPGKPSVAKRHNNPGNLKYAAWMKKYGAVPGDNSTDGGKFAKFPDVKSGLQAMSGLLKGSTYSNLPVEDAIKKWTGGKSYNIPLGDLRGKKIKDLDQAGLDKLTGVITQGEDSGYYDPEEKTVKYSGGKSTITPATSIPDIASGQNMITFNPSGETPKGATYDQAQPDDTPMGDIDLSGTPIKSSSKYNKLKPEEFLGEAFAFANNHEEAVPIQKYHPQLYTPYQVSFQDRINDNQNTFTGLAKQADYNPAALASLGAQKYAADNAVRADEFRTNQGISQDITNKNISILNDAQLKNLQLADTQMVRQATARSKTKAQTQEILNSVSSKILQNNLENMKMKTYEPLFDYRYQDTDGNGTPDTLGYEGGAAHFNFSGSPLPGGSGGSDARNKIIRDKNGNIKETQQTYKPQSEEEMAQLRLMMQKRKAYRPPTQ